MQAIELFGIAVETAVKGALGGYSGL